MPVGLACLPSVLKEHEIEVLDLFFEDKADEAVRRAVREIQPGIIGFSIRNIDNQLHSRTEYYLPEVKRYVEIVREESPMPIIAGGAGYSIFPRSALEYIGADYGVVGDGEVSLPKLVEALESCYDPSSIEGVITAGDKRGRFMPPRVQNYDEIPIPAFDVIEIEKYAAQGGTMSIIARRGCPNNCIYCDVPVSEGHRLHGKSPKRLVDEIEAAHRLGVKAFFIADNVFNYPAGYARSVADEIIKRGIQIIWGASLHPFGITAEDISLLKKSGFRVSSLGPDSGSPKMLKNLRKGAKIDDYKKLIALLKEYEIGFYMSILIGGPGENRETVKESVDFAVNAGASMTGLRVGIRITPQTELHRIAIEENMVSQSEDLMKPLFYVGNGVLEWVYDLLKENVKGIKGIFIQ